MGLQYVGEMLLRLALLGRDFPLLLLLCKVLLGVCLQACHATVRVSLLA